MSRFLKSLNFATDPLCWSSAGMGYFTLGKRIAGQSGPLEIKRFKIKDDGEE